MQTVERDHHAQREHPNQSALLDISVRNIDPYWVDPEQPLAVPQNPLHFEAHKLQLLLERLDKQAIHKPAQFSSEKYLQILEKFTSICTQINKGATEAAEDEKRLEPGELVESGNEVAAAAVGARNALGVGPRISTDNPLAG